METWRIFPVAFASGDSGIVSVTTTSVRGESTMRCTAGPENTPCEAHGDDALGAVLGQGARRAGERPGGVDHVVDDDALACRGRRR